MKLNTKTKKKKGEVWSNFFVEKLLILNVNNLSIWSCLLAPTVPPWNRSWGRSWRHSNSWWTVGWRDREGQQDRYLQGWKSQSDAVKHVWYSQKIGIHIVLICVENSLLINWSVCEGWDRWQCWACPWTRSSVWSAGWCCRENHVAAKKALNPQPKMTTTHDMMQFVQNHVDAPADIDDVDPSKLRFTILFASKRSLSRCVMWNHYCSVFIYP